MTLPGPLPPFAAPPTEADLRLLPKLEERLRRRVGTLVTKHRLLEEGDRVLVGLSGGKDSWACLELLRALARRAPIRFEVHGATVDPGFPDFRADLVAEACRERGVPHHVLPAPVEPLLRRRPDGTPCVMCSRLRRGLLYSFAKREGYTKIALGHHMDDLVETLLINQFFEGRLSTMPFKVVSDDGANTVIRPLGTCEEEDLGRFAWLKGYPQVSCGCPFASATPEQSRRLQMKALVAELMKGAPDLKYCVMRAMANVKPTHLLDLELLARLRDPA